MDKVNSAKLDTWIYENEKKFAVIGKPFNQACELATKKLGFPVSSQILSRRVKRYGLYWGGVFC